MYLSEIYTAAYFRSPEAGGELQPASASFFLGLLFNPEYGRGMSLRNVGLSPNYTALQHIRTYLS
jgi:hypothetical protein